MNNNVYVVTETTRKGATVWYVFKRNAECFFTSLDILLTVAGFVINTG